MARTLNLVALRPPSPPSLPSEYHRPCLSSTPCSILADLAISSTENGLLQAVRAKQVGNDAQKNETAKNTKPTELAIELALSGALHGQATQEGSQDAGGSGGKAGC